MGYYASSFGEISFNRHLTNAEYKILEEILTPAEYEVYDYNRNDPGNTHVRFNYYTKYYEDETNSILHSLLDFKGIRDAFIEFHGEDECFWRYVYRDGEWCEQVGEITFKDVGTSIRKE